MNTSARNNILARLRQSPTAPAIKSAQSAPAVKASKRNHRERVERFCEMMSAVHGEIHQSTHELWPELLQTLMVEKNIKSLLVSPHTGTGKTVIEQCSSNVTLWFANKPIEDYKQPLFDEIEASLTDCHSAVAETGTLILWPSGNEPRTMSLVPPVHFVLLNQQTLYNTWAEAIEAEHWENKMPTNALLISGPSKTADIQQTLAYGAHGPKELIIIMI